MLLRKITVSASIATVLLVTQAVAAPEGGTEETSAAAPAQADDHSYLPPWMRPQSSEAGATPANPDAQYAAGDPAKQKAALPGQKPAQRHRGAGIFGLMNSLNPFGR